MKKIIFFVGMVAICFCVAVSCTEEEDGNITDNALIGVWECMHPSYEINKRPICYFKGNCEI